MKQFLAIALCFLAVGVFCNNDTVVCTEADHATSFATCEGIETQCTTIISGCNGDNTCLNAVGTAFDAYVTAQAAVISALSDCECREFTCSAESSAVSLGASLILAFFAKLLL